MMRVALLPLAAILSLAVPPARGQESEARESSPTAEPATPASPAAPPSAEDLVAGVLSTLPTDPLTVTGELVVRKQRGVVVQELQFEMFLHWGGRPAVTRYAIRDAFGRDLEQLTLTRAPGREPALQYARGHPLLTAATPSLWETVQGSDVTWMDLTLAFLWWGGGRLAGEDTIRGRPCYLVDVPVPPSLARAVPAAGTPKPATAGHAAPPTYATVRLWIDKQVAMLLQAETLDASARPNRRLWIKGIKKINERWMVKEMEVQDLAGDHRTKVTVLEVKER